MKLSIITPTLNNESGMERFLYSLKIQDFPKKNTELIIVDGGSTDKTKAMAKKAGATIVHNPLVLADPGVEIGVKHAKGDLVMVLAIDNIFYESDCIRKMVEIFNDKDVIAAFPKQSSSTADSIYTKYINTFTDPFNHFVYGNACNGRTFHRTYKTMESNAVYDVYDYSSSKDRPLIAVAQGFTVRTKYARKGTHAFDDILPVMEILKYKGKIAFAHSVRLYHHTTRDLIQFIEKQGWASRNALEKKKYGIAYRMNYLSTFQTVKARLWPIYALSIIFPTLESIIGWVRDGEDAWIYHSFLCFVSALASVRAVIMHLASVQYQFKRQ
jgi:glycosyltransferase involved in cell wall biosynthesis